MPPKAGYEQAQVNAFSALVEDGTYSEEFEHALPARNFFSGVISACIAELAKTNSASIRVMDCGCGNGAWLDCVSGLEDVAAIDSFYGFDLTPEMVSVAQKRLARQPVPAYLATGDILDQGAYRFPNGADSFDLIFTYDVVQQLPRKLQLQACEVIIEHLAEGGIAVIFDNDCRSRFGRSMGMRKFATRYLGMSLVPRYYCNAQYPRLEQIAKNLNSRSGLEVKVEISPAGVKRAMIIRKR